MKPRFRIRKVYHYWVLEDHEAIRVIYTLQHVDALRELDAVLRREINELLANVSEAHEPRRSG